MTPEEIKTATEAVYAAVGIPMKATLGYFTAYVQLEHATYLFMWGAICLTLWILAGKAEDAKVQICPDLHNLGLSRIMKCFSITATLLNIINNLPTVLVPEKTAIVEILSKVLR